MSEPLVGVDTRCSVAGCEQRHDARGYCHAHYNRWKRHGDPLGGRPPTPPVIDRFWQRVQKTATCWLWKGRTDVNGYGQFWAGRRVRAHQWAYRRWRGPIPDGLELDHLCRVRHCVNPDHLEPVSHRENTLRGTSFAAIHAGKTACPQGHPYDEANTKVYRGRRYCRACHAVLSREYARRKRADRKAAV